MIHVWARSNSLAICSKSSKFRLSFPTIDKVHGIETAKRMHRLAHDGVRVVESFVDEFKLERARFEHTGSLRCAHTERALASICAEADWVRTALGDTSMTVQTREEVTHETGSAGFIGGVLSAECWAQLQEFFAQRR